MTEDEGRELQKQIEDVKNLSANNEVQAAELAKQMDAQLGKRLKKVVRRSDQGRHAQLRPTSGQTAVEKLQTDLLASCSKVASTTCTHAQDALTKQFQDYRASLRHQARAAHQRDDDGEERR